MRVAMHIGHLGELAGHDHVLAGIGIGIAIAAGVIGWVTREDDAPEADPETDEAEEQPA